jgi:pyruvate/2-oxoglutarate/acetoin dehydrogenase E1 component
MPREMMFAEAIAVAITEEMQRDPSVVFYGQNSRAGNRDWGGDVWAAANRRAVYERVHARRV